MRSMGNLRMSKKTRLDVGRVCATPRSSHASTASVGLLPTTFDLIICTNSFGWCSADSKSVDSSGGEVTTDMRQTACLGEGSVYDSNFERCCQIQKPRSQGISIPVLLLHQSKATAIDMSEVLSRPRLDHNAFR